MTEEKIALKRENNRLRLALDRSEHERIELSHKAEMERKHATHSAKVECLEADFQYALHCVDELDELKKEHAHTKQVIKDMTEQTLWNQRELTSLQRMLKEEQAKSREKQVRNENLVNEHASMERTYTKQLNNQKKEEMMRAELNNTIHEQANEIKELKRELQKIENNYHKEKQERASCYDTNIKLEKQVNTSAATIDELHAEMEGFRVTYSQHGNNTQALKDEVKSLRDQLKNHESKYKNNMEFIAKIQEKLNAKISEETLRIEARNSAKNFLANKVKPVLGLKLRWLSREHANSEEFVEEVGKENADALKQSFANLVHKDKAMMVSEMDGGGADLAMGGNPASEAGVCLGDVVISINKRAAHKEIWREIQKDLIPDDLLSLEVMRFGPRKNPITEALTLQVKSSGISVENARLLRRIAAYDPGDFAVDFKSIVHC